MITKAEIAYGTYNEIRTGRPQYYVPLNRLDEPDWLCHIVNKGGLCWAEFIPVYVHACRIQKQNPRNIAAYEATDYFHQVVLPKALEAFALAGINITKANEYEHDQTDRARF